MTPSQIESASAEDVRALLVEHVRRQAEFADDRCDEDAFLHAAYQIEADGQRIAALEARVRKLEGVLRGLIYEVTHLSPMEVDGSHWCKISADALGSARAALQEKNDG